MAILLIILQTIAFSTIAFSNFTPLDNLLVDCGADKAVTHIDGRSFKTEQESKQFLHAKDEIKVSVEDADVQSPIELTARVFLDEARYTFPLSQLGWHWVRLHFFPLENKKFDLSTATFSVVTETFVLLQSFKMNNTSTSMMKEFLLNLTETKFSVTFLPLKTSIAFINAIEVVSAPDDLVMDSVEAVYPSGKISGLSKYAFQTVYRINVGGPPIRSGRDTVLGRSWTTDEPFLKSKELAKRISVASDTIKYPEATGVTKEIAPPLVYSSAVELATISGGTRPHINVTWKMEVDPSYNYVARFHLCDIVSQTANTLLFNIYVNGFVAILDLDLSIFNVLAMAAYRDVFINSSYISDGLIVQIGPSGLNSKNWNAILNGLEVYKLSNAASSLDGEFGRHQITNDHMNTGKVLSILSVGITMVVGLFLFLLIVIKWQKRPEDWKVQGISYWLLPFKLGFGSPRSIPSNELGLGIGRYFSLGELRRATGGFNPTSIIGEGGFGNVYFGTIDDGTQVAVKRANPQSEQGITEFQTEIQMLSNLRHRHLVSLIGYCDENSEMILVYEFMSNGAFRDHLYGKDLPALNWIQRLQICIGAARGIEYLHTGTQQGIIHRDVKTTNILLDRDLTSKVSDFGLSKTLPVGQGHVSTVVKGSLGYLDPEYYRSQQLTKSSDIYSLGVVLLEAICGRPVHNPQLQKEQVYLVDWAMECKRKGLFDKIIDPFLRRSINPESAQEFAELIQLCLAERGDLRPRMGYIIYKLELILQLQVEHEKNNNVVAASPAIADVASTST